MCALRDEPLARRVSDTLTMSAVAAEAGQAVTKVAADGVSTERLRRGTSTGVDVALVQVYNQPITALHILNLSTIEELLLQAIST